MAGFVSICTHGSFFACGLFTNTVERIRIVFANGSIEWIDASSPAFKYVLGSMGLFGIITHVKIQLRKVGGIHADVTPFCIALPQLADLCDKIITATCVIPFALGY